MQYPPELYRMAFEIVNFGGLLEYGTDTNTRVQGGQSEGCVIHLTTRLRRVPR